MSKNQAATRRLAEERRAARWLLKAGGPPEIAMEITAIADSLHIAPLETKRWIQSTQRNGEWNIRDFAAHAAAIQRKRVLDSIGEPQWPKQAD